MTKDILKIDKIIVTTKDEEILEFDLAIKEGETVMFQSKDNSGSLLFDLIYLNQKIEDGDILYYDDSIKNYNYSDIDEYHSKDISMIDSINSFFDEFNISENIYLTSNLNRIDIDYLYAKELIDIFNIKDIINKSTKDISYYEFIKAKTVRSLMNKPFILLVYDIFNDLDKNERNEYMLMLNRINSLYQTTVLIESTDSSLFRYATKKYLIDEGELISVNS